MDRSSVAEEARRLVIEEMQALEKEFLRKPPPPIPPEVRSLFLLPPASAGSLGSLDLKEGMRVHRAAVDGVLRSAQLPASTDSPRVSLVDLDAHLLWLKNLVVEFEAYPLLRPLVLHVASYFATLRKNVANRAHMCKFLLRRPSRCTMKLGPLLGFRPREISGFISGLLQGKLDDHNENVVSQRLQAFLDLCNNKFDGSPQLRSLLSSVFLLSAAPGQPGDEEAPRGGAIRSVFEHIAREDQQWGVVFHQDAWSWMQGGGRSMQRWMRVSILSGTTVEEAVVPPSVYRARCFARDGETFVDMYRDFVTGVTIDRLLGDLGGAGAGDGRMGRGAMPKASILREVRRLLLPPPPPRALRFLAQPPPPQAQTQGDAPAILCAPPLVREHDEAPPKKRSVY